MVLSIEPRSVLRSYTFLVCSLMFGLPLLISYYAVSEGIGSAPLAVVAYIAGSVLIGVVRLLRRNGTTVVAISPPARAPVSSDSVMVMETGQDPR